MIWGVLMLAQLREQPLRMAITVLALALGVALGTAVYLINTAALSEFNLASKRLVGESDLVVRGARTPFAEGWLTELALDPAVEVASPVLDLEVALAGHGATLEVLGLDVFRAASLQPQLLGEVGPHLFDLFAPDGIYLSRSAAALLGAQRGFTFEVLVGDTRKTLRVIDTLSQEAYPEALGIMDIASAQWTFEQLGAINRVDLRLRKGVDMHDFAQNLSARLPPGIHAIAPQVEQDRATNVTRAYRVNLNMLALVALFTGTFLVFSTQALSVQRRQRSLALLRALGVTRRELERALLGEGAALGLLGAALGIAFGIAAAAAAMHYLNSDLGNGQLRSLGTRLHLAPLPLLLFLAVGTGVAAVGAWFPAHSAAQAPPARALKGGSAPLRAAPRHTWMGLALLASGALLAVLPPVAGLPMFGYAAIAALLFGAVLLVPSLTASALRLAPRTGSVLLDISVAQRRDNVRASTLSLASIIVSFSLMVAMAIMVYSFRISFEAWLGKLLPADVILREPGGTDTAYWARNEQARLAAAPGVARIEFRRTRQLLLDPDKAAVTLIARGASAAQTAAELPLIRNAARRTDDLPPAWISEAMLDGYGYRIGDVLNLPIAAGTAAFRVAGVWRDYARTSGSIVVPRDDYIRVSGDAAASEASVWLQPQASADAVVAALRSRVSAGDNLEIITTTALRERSLKIFDRAFIITYALEAVAVLIGLAGVSFAASSNALARRAEFGVLRHIGLQRRQIIIMLASEGMLSSAFGVLYGLGLGVVLSLVLVFVVNRQSFSWSIDFAFPALELALISAALIAAAALTAIWSGRGAMSSDAVRSVREDW